LESNCPEEEQKLRPVTNVVAPLSLTGILEIMQLVYLLWDKYNYMISM
jgi:hypothetical protein